jgi:hypothetical protein
MDDADSHIVRPDIHYLELLTAEPAKIIKQPLD